MAVIRLSTRHLGGAKVRVVIYDTLAAMHEAARRFNKAELEADCLGVTQASYNADETWVRPIVRLVRGHLGSEVASHEMHHAVTALWGAHVRANDLEPNLTHHNEPFAYAFGALYRGLVTRLWDLGYYQEDS